MAAKRLKMQDMQEPEENKQERENYTDEVAVRLGYPNAMVLRLADRLSELAGCWRKTRDVQYVDDYREVLLKMIENGYNLANLPIPSQLPDELMPSKEELELLTPFRQNRR
ncbi:hypothetical protein G4Y79_03785 [Phototrophicus methaneseepsis]|uniref:Uncharacterized protein n=1 Tax=Phototrophicus methaneseepsis TaxID=2710758 RepID=A0A7S8EAR0_9CHLR|nr:hypothetical protein [Phototrophicus methaneseepsis]QPC83515.1 hypothetical protein G4Y79_03785 [Phototrophicus methaneseepsis]